MKSWKKYLIIAAVAGAVIYLANNNKTVKKWLGVQPPSTT